MVFQVIFIHLVYNSAKPLASCCCSFLSHVVANLICIFVVSCQLVLLLPPPNSFIPYSIWSYQNNISISGFYLCANTILYHYKDQSATAVWETNYCFILKIIQNAKFINVKIHGTYRNHCALTMLTPWNSPSACSILIDVQNSISLNPILSQTIYLPSSHPIPLSSISMFSSPLCFHL